MFVRADFRSARPSKSEDEGLLDIALALSAKTERGTLCAVPGLIMVRLGQADSSSSSSCWRIVVCDFSWVVLVLFVRVPA